METFPTSNAPHEADVRLSSVPPLLRVGAVASVAGFRDSCGNVPLDTCVPVRTNADGVQALGLRTSLVLFHIDGVRSIQQIADRTALSLSETIAACFELVAFGSVDLSEARQ
jgi:hypothetical protein